MNTPVKDLVTEMERCKTIIDMNPVSVGAYVLRKNLERAEKAMQKQDTMAMMISTQTLRKFA